MPVHKQTSGPPGREFSGRRKLPVKKLSAQVPRADFECPAEDAMLDVNRLRVEAVLASRSSFGSRLKWMTMSSPIYTPARG